MNGTYKWLILLGLLIGAIAKIILQFENLDKSSAVFLFIGYLWIFYNFYALLFEKHLLAPLSIEASEKDERKYFRAAFTLVIHGGVYLALFFT